MARPDSYAPRVNGGPIYLLVLIVLTAAFALGAYLPERYLPYSPPARLRIVLAVLMLIAGAAAFAYLSYRYFPCHGPCPGAG